MADSDKPKNTPAPQRPRDATLIMPTTRQDQPLPPTRAPRAKLPDTKKAGLIPRVLLIALVVLCYFPIFGNSTLWSEYDSVPRSPYQTMDSWKSAWNIATIRQGDPITLTTYFLEELIPLPAGIVHRGINLILHLLAVFLLLRVFELFRLPGVFAASLVFALHPAVVQTIFWPGYRGEIIGLILLLAALFYGIRNSNPADFFKALTFTAIISLIRPIGLSVPLILGISIIYHNKSFDLKNFNRVLPLLCISIFIVVWTQTGPLPFAPETTEIRTSEKLHQASESMFFFMRQTVAPLEVGLFHPYKKGESYLVGAQLSLLPFFLFVPFYLLIAFNIRKRWAKALLFSLTTYLLLIIPGTYPSGNMIDGSLALENHGQYIGSPFLIALIIVGLAKARRAIGMVSDIFYKIGLSLLIIMEILITISFTNTIGNRASMWESIMTQWPDSISAKVAYVDSIKTPQAYAIDDETLIELLTKILAEKPELIEQSRELSRAYIRINQYTNAARIYRRLLGSADPSNELIDEAAEFFDKAGLQQEATNARKRKKNPQL